MCASLPPLASAPGRHRTQEICPKHLRFVGFLAIGSGSRACRAEDRKSPLQRAAFSFLAVLYAIVGEHYAAASDRNAASSSERRKYIDRPLRITGSRPFSTMW